MICKKCGKEFNSENNICTFCNHDNNVEENVQPTETSTPAEPVATEQPAAPAVENTAAPVPAAETPAAEPKAEEVEDLFADENKKEETKTELVIEEPAQTETAPVADAPAATTEPAQTEAAPVADAPATPAEPAQTEAAPVADAPATPAEPAQTEAAPVADAPAATTEPAPAEPAPTADAQPTEEKPKSKINGKTIGMLVFIVILAVVVVIIYLPKDEEEPTGEPNTNETNTPTNNETNNNNNTGNNTENNNGTETTTDIFAYSGVYKNGDVTITMYALSAETVNFMVSTSDDTDMQTLELENNVLAIEDDFFGETVSVKVEKTADGIKVTSSSSEAESVLNKITNVYTKEGTVTTNWSGVYKNGDVVFTIDQYKADELALNYLDSANYSVGQFGNIETFTETTITYESEFFDETTKITITRTATGIDVVATSTDPEEDLTSLNGSFTKQ